MNVHRLTNSRDEAPRLLRPKLFMWVVGAICALLICALLWWHPWRSSGGPPLELTSTVKTVNFTLYYPQPLPSGYHYDLGATKHGGGVVIFFLYNQERKIAISEQPVPSAPPDLNHLSGFTPFSVAAGNAAMGIGMDQTIAIVMNNTTLITLTGSKNAPPDIVRTTAASLQALQ